MFETASEKAFAGVIAVLAIFFLYLLMNMPQPTAEGYCVSQCDNHVVYSDTPYIDSSICGSNCLIDKIEYNQDITHPEEFKVTCECCDCVGSQTLELPPCEPPLGFIFKYLGRCV